MLLFPLILAAAIPAVQGGSITKGIPGTRIHSDSSISHRGGSITQVSSDSVYCIKVIKAFLVHLFHSLPCNPAHLICKPSKQAVEKKDWNNVKGAWVCCFYPLFIKLRVLRGLKPISVAIDQRQSLSWTNLQFIIGMTFQLCLHY